MALSDNRAKWYMRALGGLVLVAFLVELVWPSSLNQRTYYLGNCYALVALFGAVLCYSKIRAVGLPKNDPQRLAFTWFCGALVLWSVGLAIWTLLFYISSNTDPYPSVAEIFFYATLACWTGGLLQLFAVVKGDVVKDTGPFVHLLIILWSFAIGVIVFLHHQSLQSPITSTVVKQFGADALYLLMDMLNLTLILALVLGPVKKISHGKQTPFLYFLAAIFLDTVGDFAFIVTRLFPETDPLQYQNGNWVDVVFAASIYFWVIGLLSFPLVRKQDHGKTHPAKTALDTR